jgi:hypothetical protein
MIALTNNLQTVSIEISRAVKAMRSLTQQEITAIRTLLESRSVTDEDDAYDLLNEISYEDVTIPAVTTSIDVTIKQLRFWWRLKLGRIKDSNPALFDAWDVKSSVALAKYNEDETVRRESVIVDDIETNNFISFKLGALQYGIITESDLDELFVQIISPERVEQKPYREIDKIVGSSGNIITLEELRQILEGE